MFRIALGFVLGTAFAAWPRVGGKGLSTYKEVRWSFGGTQVYADVNMHPLRMLRLQVNRTP